MVFIAYYWFELCMSYNIYIYNFSLDSTKGPGSLDQLAPPTILAGCTGAALTLLSLGADPDAGHGALADGTIQTVKETLSLKEEATNRPWL